MERERSHEIKEIQKRIFLEVGIDPQYEGPLIFNENFKLSEEEQYIGIDVEMDAIKRAQQINDERKSSENIFFVNADGKSIPLGDKSVDTIYFGNIFGSGISEKERFLLESKRVLKQDGRIIIFDNITPRYARMEMGKGKKKENSLDAMLLETGFEITRELHSGDKDWDETLQTLGIQDKAETTNQDTHLIIIEPRRLPDSK